MRACANTVKKKDGNDRIKKDLCVNVIAIWRFISEYVMEYKIAAVITSGYHPDAVQKYTVYHDTTIASVLGGYYLQCAIRGKPTSYYKSTQRVGPRRSYQHSNSRAGLLSTTKLGIYFFLRITQQV